MGFVVDYLTITFCLKYKTPKVLYIITNVLGVLSQEIKTTLEKTINIKQRIDEVLNAYIQKKQELMAIERELETLTNSTKLTND